jgi:hypothetical protein
MGAQSVSAGITVKPPYVLIETIHRIRASFLTIPGSHPEVVIKQVYHDDTVRERDRLITIRRGNPARIIGTIPINNPLHVGPLFIRIKKMAGMDIAEKRESQQGVLKAKKEFGKSLPALSVQTKMSRGKEVLHFWPLS